MRPAEGNTGTFCRRYRLLTFETEIVLIWLIYKSVRGLLLHLRQGCLLNDWWFL